MIKIYAYYNAEEKVFSGSSKAKLIQQVREWIFGHTEGPDDFCGVNKVEGWSGILNLEEINELVCER